ncbi:hypothetical protein GOP47_0016852 [Adiantum capillus-veneris]|uniref:Uncharacterized protein n=1 Tax=Adiantum capillus-veneris TaxID=13818 RepID=A0A9D4UIU7_ADICA|nr:hypothetical protein GOP47_0016852 [Adiantum capillus-veneris]
MTILRRGAGTTAEKTKPIQSQTQRAAAPAASPRGRSNASRVWAREQAIDLSRIVLEFARLYRRLPDAGDRSFWQLCQKRFNGVFTCKQMQAKVRYLHLRFRRLADGAAKTLHLAERDSVQIWTRIMHHIAPAASPNSTSSASTRSRSASPSPSSYTHSGATHQDAGGRWGGQYYGKHERVAGMAQNKAYQGSRADANAGWASIKKAPRTNRVPFRKNAGISFEHVNGKSTSNMGCGTATAAAAGEAEPAQEASGCSTQMHEDNISQENVNEEGVGHDTAADATNTAAHKNENVILLHHVTVADLAASVRTLAEVVARGPSRA